MKNHKEKRSPHLFSFCSPLFENWSAV